MKKILIIEDDKILRQELMTFLQNYGYECRASDDFANIVGFVLANNFDLILLDINLPYVDGYHVCKEIRKESDVPIIVVTSRATDMDELLSMNLGADDFVTKPYNTQILLARIASLLRRNSHENVRKFEYQGLLFYPDQQMIEYAGKQAELTKNELHIMTLLFRQKGRVTTREELMEALWQSDEFVDDNTLTVNVNRLRRKLQQLGANDMITTKRGQGYSL
ncbi:MAG: response regulator transcription factor [Erysipelotrichaceae bacterium]|nr:response regulator transcription factor [Erysipelotrichaceae bacterium]MDY5252863.1 response regulator transcription factor [Erysipelotrichaceae bacterium]